MQQEQHGGLPKRVTNATPPLGRYYDVDGRRLLVHLSGSGEPPVVFLAGAGTVGLDYLIAQEKAAQLSTSVLYDRAGSGWSDPIKLPRTLTQVTDELRELLRVVGVPSPYLLVGHSLGGLYARHYGVRFPDEVAALLLLDPAHEDYNAYMPEELTKMWEGWSKKQLGRLMNLAIAGASRTALGRGLLLRVPAIKHYRKLYRDLFAQEMAEWPAEIREVLIERHVSLEWLLTGVHESRNVDELYDEIRHAGPMPDVPLIVLCSMGTDGFKEAVSAGVSESLLREEIDGKRRLYTAMVESVPRGEIRLVDGGHVTMHFRHPEAVAEAIQDLLRINSRRDS
ncbi:MAG TPA: alpha/beta hydrolase [Blastocatellia bacterium]|nr:alpha/beta hydrolase [Blastocatellia bacterium]